MVLLNFFGRLIGRDIRACAKEGLQRDRQHLVASHAPKLTESDADLEHTSPVQYWPLFELHSSIDDTKSLHSAIGICVHNDIAAVEALIGRPLDVIERNAFAWEPRCSAW